MATAAITIEEKYSIPPTPKQIDELVERFEQVRDQAELADERYDECKDDLIALVQRFGTVPAGAEQSLRLQGQLTFVTVTTGNTIAIKEDAVAELKAAMEVNKRGELFQSMFGVRTKHELLKDAENQLRIAELPQRLVKTFTSLFARCFDVKKKAPSLKIERLKAAKAKKAKAS